MRRSDRGPILEPINEPERFYHLRNKAIRIMADNETQAEIIERLRKEIEDHNVTIAAERAAAAAERARADREEDARRQAQERLNQYPQTAM